MTELDSIIRESDGVMVARGDLGVEVPMQQFGDPKDDCKRSALTIANR